MKQILLGICMCLVFALAGAALGVLGPVMVALCAENMETVIYCTYAIYFSVPTGAILAAVAGWGTWYALTRQTKADE